jgi:hypothetical protein
MSIPFAPPALILVNADLTPNVQDALVRQLMISPDGYVNGENTYMVMDGYEFNSRLIEDPNYVQVIHGAGLRVLVVNTLRDYTNRTLYDLVIFVKAGMATVLQNNFGPPNIILPVDQLYFSEIKKYKIG